MCCDSVASHNKWQIYWDFVTLDNEWQCFVNLSVELPVTLFVRKCPDLNSHSESPASFWENIWSFGGWDFQHFDHEKMYFSFKYLPHFSKASVLSPNLEKFRPKAQYTWVSGQSVISVIDNVGVCKCVCVCVYSNCAERSQDTDLWGLWKIQASLHVRSWWYFIIITGLYQIFKRQKVTLTSWFCFQNHLINPWCNIKTH